MPVRFSAALKHLGFSSLHAGKPVRKMMIWPSGEVSHSNQQESPVCCRKGQASPRQARGQVDSAQAHELQKLTSEEKIPSTRYS